VRGESTSNSAGGVFGHATGPASGDVAHGVIPRGVFGLSEHGEGVHGETLSAQFAAVVGVNQQVNGTAGLFLGNVKVVPNDGAKANGDVEIAGGLAVGGVTFDTVLQRIQHLEQAIAQEGRLVIIPTFTANFNTFFGAKALAAQAAWRAAAQV